MTSGGVHRRGALDMWYTIHLPASRDTAPAVSRRIRGAPAPSLSLAGTLGVLLSVGRGSALAVGRYTAGAV